MFYNKSEKRNTALFIVLPVLMVICFSSCEKEVALHHDKSENKLVIAAEISDQKGDCVVTLTKSKIYGQSGNFETVNHAIVTIKDESGTVTPLNETSPGTYINPQLAGQSGKTYLLTVAVDGKTYTASSTMPQAVRIDSVYFKNNNDLPSMSAYVIFTDPAGRENYYLLTKTVNRVKNKGQVLVDDKAADGEKITQELWFSYSDSSAIIRPGSTVMVEMKCLEKNVYGFWKNFEDNAFSNPEMPKPVTNITGGALGYFSANPVQRKTVVAH